MKHYTTQEMAASYTQKRDWEKQFPVSRYIFRPLSFRAAAFLSRFTNSPEAIAWTGLAVGACAAGLLVNLRYLGPWPGITALALFALLDAVDGNMARVTGNVTLYGRMLDGMLGKIAEGIYLPALACGLYLELNHHPWRAVSLAAGGNLIAELAPWLLVAAGFTALCAMLYASVVETTYDCIKLQKAPPPPADAKAEVRSSRFRGNFFYAVFINLNAFNVQVLLLAAAAAAGTRGLTVFLLAFCAYYTLRLLVVFSHYMRRASQEFR